MKKYSPVRELGEIAKEYCNALYESIGNIILIADRDHIVAVAGAARKEFLDKPIGMIVEQVMIKHRRAILINDLNEFEIDKVCPIQVGEGEEASYQFSAEVIAPIIVEGDAIGAVIIATREPKAKLGDAEVILAKTAANFLSRYIS